MNGWQYATLLMVCCLVSGLMGWATASLRYMDLCARVSSMEAAVAAYWDRVRKRMTVEERPRAKSIDQLTDQEILEIGRKSGLVVEPRAPSL